MEVDWKDQVCPSLPELFVHDMFPKEASQDLVGMGKAQGWHGSFANLACRKVMGTTFLHQDGVLGMIALGFH